MADCLKCSVVTHREPGQNKDDTDKFSYVDIKDSGYLPLLGLQVIAKPFKIPFVCFKPQDPRGLLREAKQEAERATVILPPD